MTETQMSHIQQCIKQVMDYLENEGLPECRIKALSKQEALQNVHLHLGGPPEILLGHFDAAWDLLHPKPAVKWAIELRQRITQHLKQNPEEVMGKVTLVALLSEHDQRLLERLLHHVDHGDPEQRAVLLGRFVKGMLTQPAFLALLEEATPGKEGMEKFKKPASEAPSKPKF